jgi:hypothetical protein
MAWAESSVGAERLAIASRPDLPPEVQFWLAGDALSKVRCALAANPAIDDEVALWIASSNDPQAGVALAQNPNLPEAVKVELCHHENREVQLQMVYRDDLSDELIHILVNETGHFDLVEHLAIKGTLFPGINAELLPPMLAHKRPSIRAFAASANSLSEAQVTQLMRDLAAPVRLRLVTNPILTPMALQELSNDWNPAVAECAQKQLKKLCDESGSSEQNPLKSNHEVPRGLVSKMVRFFTE